MTEGKGTLNYESPTQWKELVIVTSTLNSFIMSLNQLELVKNNVYLIQTLLWEADTSAWS